MPHSLFRCNYDVIYQSDAKVNMFKRLVSINQSLNNFLTHTSFKLRKTILKTNYNKSSFDIQRTVQRDIFLQ